LRFGRGGPGEVGVLVLVDHREEVFAVGDGLLGLDFATEASEEPVFGGFRQGGLVRPRTGSG
jgi:hypothetical protein